MATAFEIYYCRDLAGNVIYRIEEIFFNAGSSRKIQIVAFYGGYLVPPTSDLDDFNE